jgi:hypothetical protein
MGQAKQQAIAGTNGEAVVLQQAATVTVADGTELVVQGFVGGEVDLGGVGDNQDNSGAGEKEHGAFGEGSVGSEQRRVSGLPTMHEGVKATKIKGAKEGREGGTRMQSDLRSGENEAITALLKAERDSIEVVLSPLESVAEERPCRVVLGIGWHHHDFSLLCPAVDFAPFFYDIPVQTLT